MFNAIDDPKEPGHFHFISFTPLKWETVKEIWLKTSACRKFLAVCLQDKYAVVRVTEKNEEALGICSGWRNGPSQHLFIDYDDVPLNKIDGEVTAIIKQYKLRRGIIVQTRPGFKVVRQIDNWDGTNFYDYDREKAYRLIIGD